jgi:toxin ParE1/3/4
MKLFVQEAAEQDVLLQVAWYARKDLPRIALRFSAAVVAAFEALSARPRAGRPRKTDNPALAGLRTWPVKGFPEARVYYLLQTDLLVIVRVLHSKRNTDAILDDTAVEQAPDKTRDRDKGGLA